MTPALRAYLATALASVHGAWDIVPHGVQIGLRTHNRPLYILTLPTRMVVVDARRRTSDGKPMVLAEFVIQMTTWDLVTEIGRIVEGLRTTAARRVREAVPCRALVTQRHYTFPIGLQIRLESAKHIASIVGGAA